MEATAILSHQLAPLNIHVLESPDAPLTPQEMKLTTSLVRRQESHGVLEVKQVK